MQKFPIYIIPPRINNGSSKLNIGIKYQNTLTGESSNSENKNESDNNENNEEEQSGSEESNDDEGNDNNDESIAEENDKN